MAFDDVLFPDGDAQNFIITMNRGNGGVINDIELESGSNSGIPVEEIPIVVDLNTTVAFTWVS